MKIDFGIGNVTCEEFAFRCGGVLSPGCDPNVVLTGLCTDSREGEKGLIFVSLKGKDKNGKDYISDALQRGCSAVLCETSSLLQPAIVTRNTGDALLQFANSCRKDGKAQVVAVTGSVGKTTAKEMIYAVLHPFFSTYRSFGNYNNLLGVPLGLSELPKDSEWAVLELGMNHAGEIAQLSNCVEPDIAVITNVGSAHIGLLGSRENIAAAKLEILQGLPQNGILIYPHEEPLLKHEKGRRLEIGFSISNPCAECFADSIIETPESVSFDLHLLGRHWKNMRLSAPGQHLVYSAMIAATVGVLAGLGEEEIRGGLANCRPGEIRQKFCEVGGITLIEDCYNASPESMRAAIELLQSYSLKTNRRSICVLGDMLELGKESQRLHHEVGVKVADCGIDVLFTMGTMGKEIAEGSRGVQGGSGKIKSFSNEDGHDVVANELWKELKAGDVVLFKASHAMHEEKVIERLKELIEHGDK